MIGAVLAAAWLAVSPAVATVEGIYQLDMPETASTLILGPGGRFQWDFSQGALDLVGEGRWPRHGDRLVLTSDPPVVPPRFLHTGAGDSEIPGLLIEVTNARGKPAGNLDVAAEYADGSRESGFIQGGEYRFEPDPARRIVAMFLGSEIYGFVSERFPVAEGVTVLRFRFEANDVGKADFQAVPAAITADGLDVDWKGTTLRYARQEPPGR